MGRLLGLSSYTIQFGDDPNYQRTINTTSSGKAKYEYWLDVSDCYDMKFFDFAKNCKVVSQAKPFTSEGFRRNAQYRNIPFAYCGMMVNVGGETGYIVGHNSSANLDILFPEGKYNGRVLNCHPHCNIEYFNASGILVKSFKKESEVANG